ncbi:multiple epidermal growth factor-like domains protein 6 isoform X2 [Tachysurus ichikawai]
MSVCEAALMLCVCCVCCVCFTHFASSLQLQPDMPNVCEEQEVQMTGVQQPCVQAFTRMVKVWRQGCSPQRWCMGYERRTAYFTAYRQLYSMELKTVHKCCPGWTQRGEESGCLHRLCSADTCFNEGRCAHSGDQVCECPAGFQGTRCQYGTFPNSFLEL